MHLKQVDADVNNQPRCSDSDSEYEYDNNNNHKLNVEQENVNNRENVNVHNGQSIRSRQAPIRYRESIPSDLC